MGTGFRTLPTNHSFKPFNGILLPQTSEGDARLKSLENIAHTEINEAELDDSLQPSGKKFINNISNVIKKIMDKIEEQKNPTEGDIDTSSHIFSYNVHLSRQLDEKSRKTLLNLVKTEGTEKKTTTPRIHKKKTRQNNVDGDNNNNTSRKESLKEDDSENIEIENFYANPTQVKRQIIRDHEHVLFDFSNMPELKNTKKVDLSIKIQIGNGEEEDIDFNIDNNYSIVTDELSKNKCKIINNKIKDITVKNRIALLNINLKEEYNHSMKLLYYLEVKQ